MDIIKNGLVIIIANCKEFDAEINSGAIQLTDGTSHCVWNDGIDDKYIHQAIYITYNKSGSYRTIYWCIVGTEICRCYQKGKSKYTVQVSFTSWFKRQILFIW